ncbi:Major intracellular serine protease precursor [Bacillus cereus]|nr:Major intracellular serine protease precursor [Bacillus cereus]
MKKMKIIVLLVLFFVQFYAFPLEKAYADEEMKYYTILLKDKNDTREFTEQLHLHKGTLVYSVDEVGLVQIKISENNMKQLSSMSLIDTYNPSIRAASSQTTHSVNYSPPSESLFNHQWDMKAVTNNGESYTVFSGNKNTVVGIIDSGLDLAHPDLKNNIIQGSMNLVPKGGFRGEEISEDGDQNYLVDKLGHGTHVAGQIAGNGRIKGVAPEIGIRAYRVFGEKSADTSWIIKGIVEAAKDDVDVINLSLGSYLVDGVLFSEDKKLKKGSAEIKAYNKAIQFAKEQGSIVVAAAGNDGLDVRNQAQMREYLTNIYSKDGISFFGEVKDIPADLPDVVTVGSVGPTNQLSIFSNYGDDFIDIVSPGGDYRMLEKYGKDSWVNNRLFMDEQVLSTWPGGYFYTAGNSIAAPKVSGALALIVDKYKFKNKPDKAVDFLYKYGVDKKYSRNFYGNGVLNIYKVVNH